ncbi:MAG TPA: hypothetical protein VLV86_19370, partial [Vicinamibacterales bacterium]|nr:hypothetical protein [Vicinamibacterales bacterium]
LYRALVIDHSLAVSAGGWYQSTAVDDGQFAVSASPKPGVEFAEIERVIDSVIATFQRDGLAADVLDRTKTELVSAAIYAQDSQVEMARWFGSALATGQSIDDVLGWANDVRAVTSDDVREAARKWLNQKRSVTGYLIKDTTEKIEAGVEEKHS